MVRIGLIGCGRWGSNILRDLKTLNCEITVVVHSDRSAAAARSGGAHAIVNRLEHMPAVDGIVVAAPTVLHGSIVLEVLESRSCPVFCEKPLTNSVLEARAIVEKGRHRVFVMDKWRYHPGIEALRNIGRSGELGPVLGLKTVRLGWGNPHRDVDSAWNLLPHDLSIAMEILGHIPKPVHSIAECDASGLMNLSVCLENPLWMMCEVSTRYPGHRRSVELRCRLGVAVLEDSYDAHIHISRSLSWAEGGKPEALEKRPIALNMPLLAELSSFVDHLGGGPPPRSTAVEGLRVVETIAKLRTMAGLCD